MIALFPTSFAFFQTLLYIRIINFEDRRLGTCKYKNNERIKTQKRIEHREIKRVLVVLRKKGGKQQ